MMKRVGIGIAAIGVLLAGCSTSEAPPAVTTTVTAAPADPSVAEWHRIAEEFHPKIRSDCMDIGESVMTNVCLGMTSAAIKNLEKKVELQPAGPYRTEMLDNIANFQRVKEQYDSTEMWCDGGNVQEALHCSYFGELMDSDAGRVEASLAQMLAR